MRIDEYKRTYIDVVKIEERRGFLMHLMSYIFINAIFIAANLMYSPNVTWFVYPILGWGIGLLIHFLWAFIFSENDVKNKQMKAEYIARQRAKTNEISLDDYKIAYREIEIRSARRGFFAHLSVYVIVNALLIFINLFYSPEVLWFAYPLLGWGLGIVMHGLGTMWTKDDLIGLEARVEYMLKG